jgi:hypothetical protein
VERPTHLDKRDAPVRCRGERRAQPRDPEVGEADQTRGLEGAEKAGSPASRPAQGPAGPPVFPLPWAIDPSASYLSTPEALRAAVEQAGLRIFEQVNFAAAIVKRGDPPYQANDVVMGDDFELRRANVMSGLREQRLVDQLIIAEKP